MPRPIKRDPRPRLGLPPHARMRHHLTEDQRRGNHTHALVMPRSHAPRTHWTPVRSRPLRRPIHCHSLHAVVLPTLPAAHRQTSLRTFAQRHNRRKHRQEERQQQRDGQKSAHGRSAFTRCYHPIRYCSFGARPPLNSHDFVSIASSNERAPVILFASDARFCSGNSVARNSTHASRREIHARSSPRKPCGVRCSARGSPGQGLNRQVVVLERIPLV